MIVTRRSLFAGIAAAFAMPLLPTRPDIGRMIALPPPSGNMSGAQAGTLVIPALPSHTHS